MDRVWLLALLAIVVAADAAAVFTAVDKARVKDLFSITFGPIVGLVGSVLGFYIGTKAVEQSQDSDG